MDTKLFICVFFILHSFVEGVTDRNIRIAHLNRKIDASYNMETVEESAMYSCANLCVYRTDCMSISFSQDTRTCELYLINSSVAATDGKLVEDAKTVLVDISDWIQVNDS